MSTPSSSTEIVKVIPIVYGTTAHKLKKVVNQNTHKWTVFVKCASSANLEHVVQSVTFKLHESFANPVRGKNEVQTC
jgi:YEATS domain-containing protein 4